ncbi:MAG: acyltransferase family protein, partial [Candidatus Nanopelagicales bacterium]
MASPEPISALPLGERSSRRPDIQGLRALAVVLVVLFHARLPVSGGFIGVDVFFAISGFVITAMLLRQRAQTGRIAMGTFYSQEASKVEG